MTVILTQTGKRAGALLLTLLIGISLPLLIWIAVVIGFWQLFTEWRVLRGGLLAGNLACSINTDCPSGYQCIGGKCLPATRS